MQKFLFGAVAAIFLLAAPAATLADEGCKNCNHKKDVTAQADKKDDKKDDKGCHCAKDGGACKCGDKCACSHCKEHKGEKKDEGKKA